MQIQVRYLTIIFIIFSQCLFSQMPDTLKNVKSFGLEIQIGYPSFNFDEIIEARDKAVQKLGFPAKVTDDFPHIPYSQGEILFCNKNFNIGFAMSYLSTGTRVHYADYSGEYKFENIISNYEYGLIFKTSDANASYPLKIQFAGEVGLAYLEMKAEEFLRIGNQKTTYEETLSNIVVYSELGFSGVYLWNNFIISAGFSIYLEYENDLTIGFQGARFHGGLGYRIKM